MAIVLDGSSLTIEKLVRIARFGEPVELAPAALERISIMTPRVIFSGRAVADAAGKLPSERACVPELVPIVARLPTWAAEPLWEPLRFLHKCFGCPD